MDIDEDMILKIKKYKDRIDFSTNVKKILIIVIWFSFQRILRPTAVETNIPF